MPEQKYANIGMNDVVSIKPTVVGWQKIVEKADHQNKCLMEYPLVTYRAEPPQLDLDGYIKGQFWYLMQMFDWPECVNGCDVFFSDMRIIVPPDPQQEVAVSDKVKHPEELRDLMEIAEFNVGFISNPITAKKVKRAKYAVDEIRRLRARVNRLVTAIGDAESNGNHNYSDQDLILEEGI